MKIGFFDSGIGGLTILKAVRESLPDYAYVYFGDTANVPYGGRPEEEVFELTRKGIARLFDEGALVVIVACNTASAESVRKLQDSMLVGLYAGRKLLGVIIPTIETLIEHKAQRPLLIGTERTIESHKYERELSKLAPEIKLRTVATPELVPLIESNKHDEAFAVLTQVLDHMAGSIDALVLGCTHYTVLKSRLRAQYRFAVISQDEIIPAKLKAYLYNHPEIEKLLSREGGVEILLSAENELYKKLKEGFVKA